MLGLPRSPQGLVGWMHLDAQPWQRGQVGSEDHVAHGPRPGGDARPACCLGLRTRPLPGLHLRGHASLLGREREPLLIYLRALMRTNDVALGEEEPAANPFDARCKDSKHPRGTPLMSTSCPSRTPRTLLMKTLMCVSLPRGRARTHENRSARPCVAVAGGSRSRPRNSPAPHTRLSSTGSLCTRKTINKPEWALPPAPRGEGCAGPLVWMEGSGAAAAPGSWNALAPGEEARTAARRPEVHACHAALRQVLSERKRVPLRDAPPARPAVRVECWVSAAGEGPSDSHGGPRALVPAGPGQGVLGGASSWTGGAMRSRVRV
ncbi:uncharacterized protein [Equus caballus]|uniref:uncharacterized protein isoform X2 n=1 Tax=Equus caballus TaxID=9796 RepID=UPI0038B3295E